MSGFHRGLSVFHSTESCNKCILIFNPIEKTLFSCINSVHFAPGFFELVGQCYEAYVSTERDQACSQSWLSRTDGYKERSPNYRSSPCQRSQASHRLIEPVVTTVVSLPSRSDFDKIFRSPDAKASNRDFLILACLRQHPETISRIGFVTPKKKLRRAVDRNRFRRVHREYLRAHGPSFGIDCIVIAKMRPDELFGPAFQHQVHRIFQKLFRHLAESTI